jgi:glycosyltransferase involved in cell wall biosynthesis
VVHNSIDQRKFRRLSGSARADVRHKLSIDASIPLIGVVGDVIPRKGLLYLIRALPKILAVVPTAQLLVVGNEKTKYARVVREAATNLGVSRHITWAGLRSDIPKVLSALDLFVLPTLEDNLPLSVLEAMATGLPVVATTIGGLPECVISGETGTLVPSRKPAELATAINRLLQDSELCVRYGKSARRRVREHFSPESQSPRIEQVFRRVTG